MTDPPFTQLAISELLRAAELCLISTNETIRGVGVMLITRAAALAEGKIEPEVVNDEHIDRICDLLNQVTNKQIDYKIPWDHRLYVVK